MGWVPCPAWRLRCGSRSHAHSIGGCLGNRNMDGDAIAHRDANTNAHAAPDRHADKHAET